MTAKDNRLFVDAVRYRYRAGIPWRDLPERFGDFRVVHLRHSRWSKNGVWQRGFEALGQETDSELRDDRRDPRAPPPAQRGSQGGHKRKPSGAVEAG